MSYDTFNPHAYKASINQYLYERIVFMKHLKQTDPKEYEKIKKQLTTKKDN